MKSLAINTVTGTQRSVSFLTQLMVIFGIATLSGCDNQAAQKAGTTTNTRSNQVVMYCSVDEVYARPIIRALEAKTGLTIRPLFDVEASKTAGLASRIRAEKNAPRADIFWSSAALQTLLLSREGLLTEHSAPQSEAVLGGGTDWLPTGIRARVLVYHASVKQPPRALNDLLSPRFKDKIGISNPLFGTGSDWVAALSARRGHENTLNYFRRLKANGAKVLPGNSVVAERVGRGDLLAGVTDTDDFLALQKQFPALRVMTRNTRDMVFIPMTAAILKGAPHTDNAKKLMDAFASPEVEAQIVKAMPGVLPLVSSDNASANDVSPSIASLQSSIATLPNDTDRWADSWRKMRDPLADVLLQD